MPNTSLDPPLTPIIDTVTGSVTEIGRRYLRTLGALVGALPPVDAHYLTSTSNPTLTGEVNLGALASGYLKLTTAIGIGTPSTVAAIPQADVTGLVAALAAVATLPIAEANVTGLVSDLSALVAADTAEANTRSAADTAAATAVRTVPAGGTGVATLGAHGVLVGNAAAAIAVTGAGTAGQVLTSNGASADPTFQAAAGGAVDVGVCEGRLTLTALTPVTTADVTGATAIKWTPYKGKYVALFDGTSAWTLLAFVETSLALGTLTAALCYDVFAYNNAGTLALELLAWTSATARATALVLQDGVLVKTGATTRRYLGTFYTTSTTTTEDSGVKRFVWNFYNRIRRPLVKLEATASWTYTTFSFRQANGSTANQLDVVVGWTDAVFKGHIASMFANSSTGVDAAVMIAEDLVVGAPAAGCLMQPSTSAVANVKVPLTADVEKYVPLGRHFYAWLEVSQAAGVSTFYGTAGFGYMQAGMMGAIDG